MNYERDKEIFNRNKKNNIINKLDSYLSRTNCTIEDMVVIMDIVNNMEIEKLEELEKYLDNSKKDALHNRTYIIDYINELINVEQKSEEIVNNIEEIDDNVVLEDQTVSDKLGIYLLKSNCSSQEMNEILKLSDTIIAKNVIDLDKVEEFIDIANKNEIYNVNFLKSFMNEIVAQYSNETEITDIIENHEELIDEEIEEVTRNKKNITTWFKEKFSKKEKKDKLHNYQLEEISDVNLEFEQTEDEEIEEVIERQKTKLFSKKQKGEKKPNKIVKFFKAKNSKKDIEIKDEEIEEVTERQKTKLLSKKEKSEKKPNKTVEFFKVKNSKKDIEIKDEEIEEVTQRQNSMLFSKEDKQIENIKEETKYEDLSMQDKLFKYLYGIKYTWKDLNNIVNKVTIISENKEKAARLNEFLDKNKNLDNDKKVATLVYEIVDILGKVENKESTVKINPMCEQIKEFFAKNKLDESEDVINLYNEIIMSNDNIDKIYDYVLNNMEEAKNADNIINEMNKILGKEVEKNNAIELPKTNTTKVQTAPIVTKAKMVFKKVANAEEPIVELTKTNTTKVEKENKVEISYDKYKKVQDELNDKLSELEYLKYEYSILEKSIYGKSLDKLSVEKKRDIMLTTDSQKLIQFKEKLSEIKEVQQQIEKLSLRARAYYMKYGVDVKSAYEEKYSKEYNEAVSLKEREDKMDESLYLFNKFKDDEMVAIYKYMNYEKTLK